ncbi:MAG: hypothetical protein P1V97_08510 [Planctomycetota bacterium]|nr:hypothetical protein [Planctomycetota bacterium]
MAKAIDVGTCFLVGAELRNGKEVFTRERDAFFSMPKEDFSEEMLTDAGAKFMHRGDELFVVGEDALKYCMLTGKEDSYRRPMAQGILNPSETEAIPLLELLMTGILGEATEKGEIVAATVPAAALEKDMDVTFHKIVIERHLKKLGYDVRILNEALALIFAENPQGRDERGPVPFTGIAISFGAGMTNLVVAYRAKKLFEISVARGGDWIDQHVSRARNVPFGKVTHTKEKKLDLSNVDMRDSIQVALDIYYEDLIEFTLEKFAEHFKNSNSVIDYPMEIVVGGGTASVPGFVQKFEETLKNVELPMEISRVRLARDPLHAVARGSLVAAVSMEKKKKKEEAERKKREEEERRRREEEAARFAVEEEAGSPVIPEDIEIETEI